MESMPLTSAIREVVKNHANLAVDIADITDGVDLYSCGMTSHASVNLMLALEERFDIEFPDRMLRRRSFESIAAIRSAIEELTGAKAQ